jgi:hypothetical protein
MGSQLPEEDGPRLRLERPSEHVAVVVIDAPAVANALSGRFFAELDIALNTIEQDDAIRAWLLTGAPRPDGRPWFSSGADLSEAAAGRGSGGGPHGSAVAPAAVVDRVDDLGFLQLQADMPKNEALRWAQLTPGYMGLELRPFQDSANRFYRNRAEPSADAGGSPEIDEPD